MNEKRKMPMPKKIGLKIQEKTVGHAKCFKGVARKSQRDWPNSGFLVILFY